MEVNTINPDQTASRESLICVDIVRHKDYLRTKADEIADDKSRDLRELVLTHVLSYSNAAM